MKEKDNEKLLEKMREKEERYKKLKMDKEEYAKFYGDLKKEITIKKSELEEQIHKKVRNVWIKSNLYS